LQLVNLSSDQLVADNIDCAHTFFKRLKGLMFTSDLNSGAGLHIKPCQSIHTFFMKYSIDILYLNEHNVVVALDESMEPGKIGKRCSNAVSVVELPSGTVKKTNTKIGNNLKFI
jgi:uncharacterized membrane protein (UPF0127 family)